MLGGGVGDRYTQFYWLRSVGGRWWSVVVGAYLYALALSPHSISTLYALAVSPRSISTLYALRSTLYLYALSLRSISTLYALSPRSTL